MKENNDRENNEKENMSGESNEETTIIRVPDNPSVSMTEVQGEIYVPNEEEFGCSSLVDWAKDLPRDEPVAEAVGLYIDNDSFAITAGPALEISVPLSMIEELIAVYRDENRARIRVTS